MKSKFKLKGNVTLGHELMASDAFTELSAHQIRVLLRFLQKRTWTVFGKGRKKEVVFDNSGLVFTYHEAEILGIKKALSTKRSKNLFKWDFLMLSTKEGGLAVIILGMQ